MKRHSDNQLLKFTEEEFKLIISTSYTMTDAIRALNYKHVTNAAREQIKSYANELNIDLSHFERQKFGRGRPKENPGWRKPVDEITDSRCLKTRLIKTGILEFKCYRCGITEWMGEPAPLQLDHIDGNHRNNDLYNLRILCPNCHAQTETFCGRNTKNTKRMAQRKGSSLT